MKSLMNMEMEHARAPSGLAGEGVHHDPVWLVQRAWSEFRLQRLQQLIQLIIVDLQALPPPELAAASVAPPTSAGRDPAAEALRACCDELREASGMPGAEADRARHWREMRDYSAQQPAEWSEAFAEAMVEYRKAAVSALQSTFRKSAVS